jgi:hypothetical protein
MARIFALTNEPAGKNPSKYYGRTWHPSCFQKSESKKEVSMKNFGLVILVLSAIAGTTFAFAAGGQSEAPSKPLTRPEVLQRFGFVDEDGDGINDLARDSDNDGIPNCLDSDWVRPRDGKGFQSRYGYNHQNVNKQGGGPFNYNYNYTWSNNWGDSSNPNFCNQTDPNVSTNRNRRSNRKH